MTGGCGFIGTNLVQELVAQAALVTVIDLPASNWERMPSGVKTIKADILDKRALKGSMSGIEIVYHLAARADLNGKSIEDYSVNFDGTKNLIDELVSIKSKARFVFYSTQLVVGLFNETRFIDENEPYKTKTPYGESKIEGEKVVKQLCVKYSIPFTIIRPTSVYGPWGEAPYKDFFNTIKQRKYFHIGKAKNLVSWVYVKNLVGFTLLASTSKQAEGKIFYGADFHPYTMHEIVDAIGDYYKIKISTIPVFVITPIAYFLGIFKAIGINVPIYPFRLKNIMINCCYDIQNCVALGYQPEYGIHRGIQETLDWYESNNFSF